MTKHIAYDSNRETNLTGIIISWLDNVEAMAEGKLHHTCGGLPFLGGRLCKKNQ
jgi:hypothetical protein